MLNRPKTRSKKLNLQEEYEVPDTEVKKSVHVDRHTPAPDLPSILHTSQLPSQNKLRNDHKEP
jgi:hypothetical protein